MNLDIFRDEAIKLKDLDFGAKTDFTTDSFPNIPKSLTTNEIIIDLRQRFVSYGLIDNLIIHLSKENSIAFGLWILGCYFQQNYELYTLTITNENSAIKEIWIDFRGDRFFDGNDHKYFLNNQNPQVTLDKFCWTADSVENFDLNSFYFNQKISFYVTNSVEKYFNMEQFYERDILIGFGNIGGGLLAAEFFLNFGLTKSNVNYEYIKYEFGLNLADENSCEIRAELIHDNENFEEETRLLN